MEFIGFVCSKNQPDRTEHDVCFERIGACECIITIQRRGSGILKELPPVIIIQSLPSIVPPSPSSSFLPCLSSSLPIHLHHARQDNTIITTIENSLQSPLLSNLISSSLSSTSVLHHHIFIFSILFNSYVLLEQSHNLCKHVLWQTRA